MSRRRPAFTMIDLLILLAILAFLAALLIPATQKARGAATRTQSMNNLKQMALATHAFHDGHKYLPPIVGTASRIHGTAHALLLPYIEQAALYNRAVGGDSLTIANMPIAIYVDPRDTSAPPQFSYMGWLATTSYPANALVCTDKKQTLPGIRDGSSNTLMFAQRFRMCNGEPTAWGYSFISPWTPMFGYYSTGRFQTAPSQADCDPALTQALDSSGILVAMCDGTVRLIGPDISPETWYAATDPNDRKTPEEGFLD